MANDLISRKTLLAEYDRVHIGIPGRARKLIENAPSVDAAEMPIWATETAYKNGYEAGKPKWILVKERKPTIEDADEIGLVLVYTKNNEYLITHFDDVWRFADFISHWMPLPELPKGE